VAAEPVRLGDRRTIVIPNTVAIVRGTRRETKARQLVDFLLSEETELALSRSKSRQIPLGSVPPDQLSVEVRELAEWAKDGIDLRPLSPARAACLEWLKSEYFQ
jgi:iron(III) transport system substrate-binding protein